MNGGILWALCSGSSSSLDSAACDHLGFLDFRVGGHSQGGPWMSCLTLMRCDFREASVCGDIGISCFQVWCLATVLNFGGLDVVFMVDPW